MGCCQVGAGKANGKQGHGVIDSALGPTYRVKLKHESLIKSQHLQIRGEGEIDGGGGGGKRDELAAEEESSFSRTHFLCSHKAP